jgi:hypothetical protein
VITKYGNKRSYKVSAIERKLTPLTCTFDSGKGVKVSMAAYFLKTYNIKIQDTKQHLFFIQQKRGDIYLPPELCSLVGIP